MSGPAHFPARVGLWPRLAAFALDLAGLATLLVLATVVLVRVGAIALEDGVVDLPAIGAWWAGVHPGVLGAVPIAAAFACWSTLGATPGQLLLGSRVTRMSDGATPGPVRAFVRVAASLLALAPLGVGVLRVAWEPSRRGWHDLIAGTAVTIDDESHLSIDELERLLR